MLLFNFVPSTCDPCSQPELPSLPSTLTNFALEVNMEGSFNSLVQFLFFVFQAWGYMAVFVSGARKRGRWHLVLQL